MTTLVCPQQERCYAELPVRSHGLDRRRDQRRDRRRYRRGCPSYDPADGILRHEDLRQKEPEKNRNAVGGKKKRGFVFGGVKSKDLTAFTRQLSILQDAGLPILRSLRILGEQSKPGRLKYSLEDTCEFIESGDTLSEAMAKSPKCFDRLYINMIKAGEAGGALEVILQRLADFKERSANRSNEKSKSAAIYPVFVVLISTLILDRHHDLHRAEVPRDLRRLRAAVAPDDGLADRILATGASSTGI